MVISKKKTLTYFIDFSTDPEKNHMKKIDKEGGIKYTENQIKTNDALAERLDITPMRFNYPV